jgi:hypothetical protein
LFLVVACELERFLAVVIPDPVPQGIAVVEEALSAF